MASRVEAMASVAPQVTVSSVSGSTVIPYQSAYFRAMASRRCLAPHVMAYWLMSAAMARAAASFRIWGAGKLGNPCARLIASCCAARRVIPRMTDSVKECVRRAVCMGPNDNLLDGLQLAGSIGSVRNASDPPGRSAASAPGPRRRRAGPRAHHVRQGSRGAAAPCRLLRVAGAAGGPEPGRVQSHGGQRPLDRGALDPRYRVRSDVRVPRESVELVALGRRAARAVT